MVFYKLTVWKVEGNDKILLLKEDLKRFFDRMILKNDGTYWDLFGLRLFSKGSRELLDLVKHNLTVNKRKYWIATVNPEFVMKSIEDRNFALILGQTSINVVDGIGLVWAHRIIDRNYGLKRLGEGLKVGMDIVKGKYRDEIAAGADLLDQMCGLAEKMDKTVYFLGGWERRAEKTAEYFKSKYPKLRVAGAETGGNGDPPSQTLRRIHPDFLFVAFGMKRQEEWIVRYIDQLDVGVVMGVGRSFDYYSGELQRAPVWAQRMGMEWFYSLMKEPKRWRRQLALPRFIWKVISS